MSKQYDKIVKLKPIIEGSPELVERLKACFDYTAKYSDITENNTQCYLNEIRTPEYLEMLMKDYRAEKIIYGYLRNSGELPPVSHLIEGSNITRHIFHDFPIKCIPNLIPFYLKTSKNWEFPYDFMVDKCGGIQINPVFYEELGVLDFRNNIAGLIMEDFTQGGQFKQTATIDGETGIFEGEDEKKREAKFDMKYSHLRSNTSIKKRGLQFLNPEARIELR